MQSIFSSSSKAFKSKSTSSYQVQEDFICYFWQGYNGMRQGYLVSREQYEKSSEDQTIAAPIISLFLPALKDATPANLSYPNPSVNLKIVPNKATYHKPGGFNHYSGMVFCNFFNKDGTIFQHCPRYQLESALNQLEIKYGLEIKVGFELEFSILNKDLTPIETNCFANIDSTLQYYSWLTAIASQMKQQDIKVDCIHKESAKGQFEFVLGYKDAITAVDDYHIARQIIKNCISQTVGNSGEKSKVSYLPKADEEDLGNGLHANLSIWKDGVNILGDKAKEYGLSNEAESFIAGILQHYDALIHFLAPSPNSLKRFVPDFCSGIYKIWGIENREAPIRVIESDKPGDNINHFEIKSLDHTANQYLALAAIVVAGMQGLDNKLTLPSPFNGDPHDLTPEQRDEKGIQLLPNTFEERKKALQSKEAEPFVQFFGQELIDNILSFQDIDFKACENLSLSEQVKFLVDKY
ncbi:glutamine synthetase [Stylonychia lemnae]|uniref:Glutamine synthetase n=1 Tax=Stylonychia lemnae TaxID=5949 RepID=A0A078A2J6_STYLE|nr:glutamine synthetase [Stylonychia lemnae]|eukprot:CDW76320.1 glutamine synthetase [Stylonychia lemnae]